VCLLGKFSFLSSPRDILILYNGIAKTNTHNSSLGDWHPAPPALRQATADAATYVSTHDSDLASLALRFAVRETARRDPSLPSMAEVESCAAAANSVKDVSVQGKYGDLRDQIVVDEQGVKRDEALVEGVRSILGEWVDYSFGSPPEGWDVEAGRMGDV
jgi:D-arabinose 1-dehydrogenase